MKHLKLILTITVLLISFDNSNAQVTIGDTGDTVDPDVSALLDIKSSANKGLLLPRVAITDTTQFVLGGNSLTPAMMVYSTAPKSATNSGPGVYYWKGNRWSFTGNSMTSLWKYGGNTILPETSSQALGTTNATDFNIITNNTIRTRVDKDGKVSVNTLPLGDKLDYLLVMNGDGNLVKSDLIADNLIWKKVYTTPSIATGESASITLNPNPTNCLLMINTGNGCGRPSSATFEATGNSMLHFLGGWVINARLFASASVNSNGDSVIVVTGNASYGCGDGSAGDMSNFTIRKSGSVITITNNAVVAPAAKRGYQIVQIIY